jgi:excisionase family DNA binding protein
VAAYATQITESVPSAAAARGCAVLMRDEVMTAREVAELLRMPTATVYELARKGVLPARQLGRTWRSYVRASRSCSPAEASPD